MVLQHLAPKEECTGGDILGLGRVWMGRGLLPRSERGLVEWGVQFGRLDPETAAPPSGQFPAPGTAENLPLQIPAPLHYSTIRVPSCEVPGGYSFTLSINALLSP